MAAAAERLLLPVWGGSLKNDKVSRPTLPCELASSPAPRTVLCARPKRFVCQAALDFQPREPANDVQSSLSLTPESSQLTLERQSSLADEDAGQPETRWRRGNLDKKSQRKWVRESIDWEATGIRTRGRTEELLRAITRLPAKQSIDNVMLEYAGRASVESLNDVVKGLGRADNWQRALSVFQWMQSSRFQQPNAHTYTNIISILGRGRQVATAEEIFRAMKQEGVKPNIFHYNALLACYTRNRLVPEALSLFQEMEERQLPLDAYTYSNMINACVKGDLGLDKALQLFDRMERSGLKGDLVVYSSLLHACVKAHRVEEAERVLEEMGKAGHSPNLFIYTEMIKLYGRAGKWRSAETMFYDMKRKKQKMDSTLYTAMIDAYGRCGQYDEALSVFYDMRTAGYVADVVTYSALISACAAIGDYTEAGSIVEVMVNSGVTPNAYTYTGLIQAAGKAGEADELPTLVAQMREAGLEPTAVTHAVLVDAFGRCKKFVEMEEAVVNMRQAGFAPNLKVYTSVVTAYALAGDEPKLREWFGRVKEDGLVPDLRLWTSFLYGLGKAGQYGAMMDGLEEMKAADVSPNEATYTAVLDALFGGAQYSETVEAFADMEAADLKVERPTFKRLCRHLSQAHRALQRDAGEEEPERQKQPTWAPEKLAAIEEYERAVRGLLRDIEEDDELDWEEEDDDDVIEAAADVSKGPVGDVSREGVVFDEDEESGLEDEWVGMVSRALNREAEGLSARDDLESDASEDDEAGPSKRDASEVSARRLAKAETLVRGWTAEDNENEEGDPLEPSHGGEASSEEDDGEEWVWEDEDLYADDTEGEELESFEEFLASDKDLDKDFDDDFDPNVDYRKLLKEGKVRPKE